MAVLLLAEHSQPALERRHGQGAHRCQVDGAMCTCSSLALAAAPPQPPLQSSTAPRRCCVADAPQYRAMRLAEELAALIVPLDGELRCAGRAGHRRGQERAAPRGGPARRHADVRHHQGDLARYLRAPDLRRQCAADGAVQRQPKKVITVRTSAFAATAEGGSAPDRDRSGSGGHCGVSSFVGAELTKSDRPELAAAKIIISGGRGMASGENFTKYIEPVADKLGAAMGASRAAVDAGFVPNDYAGRPDRQGRGARTLHRRRHLGRHPASGRHEGLQVIVAINKDGEAPIFQVADYGLVADLFQALPELDDGAREGLAANLVSAAG